MMAMKFGIHQGGLAATQEAAFWKCCLLHACEKQLLTVMLLIPVFVSFKSHDRLQVYGGHTDMIMCMTIHKSMVTSSFSLVSERRL